MTTMPVPVVVPVIMLIALVVLLPRGMMSLAVVFHFGHISFVAIHVVGDSLDTTIGQLDVIFALGHVSIAMLIVAKIRAVIVVMDLLLSLPLITLALILFLGSVVLGDDKHHGYHDHHPAYYKYGYKVHDDYHGTDFGHNEHRDGHVTKGEYHVKLPDGRVQTVTYYVDGYKGYVAEVKYHGKAHHPAGKKHHKGYEHDHGHDHGHGHGGHSEFLSLPLITLALILFLGSVVLGDDKHHGYHDHHPAYYKYGYKVHDDYHGTDFGHNEHRDGHVTKGEYHVKLPDGRVQTVTYYVDGYKGYVAEVKYHGKAHHPAGKKHHKGYGHDHGHDHGHGHGGHSELLSLPLITVALILVLGSVVLGDDKHHGYHDHHPAYYKYGYKVHDDYHGTDFGHNEHRDGHVTKGEYHVKLPDGRVQTVTYYVDGYKGYVAEVKYHGKAHHPAGKKHHKGYGHDHGHDHGHGHGGHSEVYGHQKPGHDHGHHGYEEHH
eukprot:maker-scaffold544_size141056-snap-gene-0.35 protein:Tk06755 transcript:maker-scaffold544_size141056-snap-gene-0.35-mRNA-1 annotation:"larval cuticle protein a3a-like"